ncbi:MAG: Enoyl-CoA hydratase/isomerase [Hydrocarboniphaga sp.]|uniref:crotonase/enoyl-CoA hydratase family protein n=1 Tax=Hydrocarboniphaga sp. TaxID=2033016 RepID=UPI00262822FA|nr:crotonase/enoyl-CoA hydratase family protein [Hydrocarboniphaga sp.]MDB5970155.1 Enoyl-CoA hydratase/isomerase [Hydrocarboniphaga sp.]
MRSYEMVKYEVVDRIATLTLNRPKLLNAFNVPMMHELIDAFDRIDADDEVRAVVVTGEGRGFCAGADLSGGTSAFVVENGSGAAPDYSSDKARDGGGRLTLRIFECLKPVIGAINGPAVGIGATMSLPMDVRLCSDSARFGFVFARRGIVPEAASSYFLPRLVGISRALQWCCSGRVFGAEEALQGGLVQAVYPAAELLPAAYAMAREMTEHSSPVSVALTRQMMWRGLGMDHPMQAHRIDSRGVLARSASGDAAEGVNSFLEKRPAQFPDKVSEDMPDFFPWWEEVQYR